MSDRNSDWYPSAAVIDWQHSRSHAVDRDSFLASIHLTGWHVRRVPMVLAPLSDRIRDADAPLDRVGQIPEVSVVAGRSSSRTTP